LAGGNLKVLVCSSNIGNKMPESLDAWIPKDGGHHDIIAVGMQESTFRVHADFSVSIHPSFPPPHTAGRRSQVERFC
jgi:hypothetical protein